MTGRLGAALYGRVDIVKAGKSIVFDT